MGFKEKLRLRDLLSFLTAPSRKSLIYVIDDDDNSTVPATKSMFGGGSGGGGTDPASAREATLQQVRDRLAVQPATILGRQTLTLTSTPQLLSVPAGTLRATLGVRGGSASVALASPAPTASTGLLWADGSAWELHTFELSALKAVLSTGAPVLDVTYVGTGSGGGGTTSETSTTSRIWDRNSTVDWWRFTFNGNPKSGTAASMVADNGTHALTYRDISAAGYSALLADEWGISGGYVFVGITYTNPTTSIQSVTVQVTA